jgi:MFS superfamily sulfate permease-like transporter
VVSLLTLFWDLNHPSIVVLGRKPGTDVFRRTAVEHPDDERIPGLLILRVESPLYFGNAHRVIDRVAVHVRDADRPPRVLLLHCSAVSDADTTAASVLAERTDRLETHGTEVWLAALTVRVLELARRSPRWDSLNEQGRVHPTVAAAVHAFLATSCRLFCEPAPSSSPTMLATTSVERAAPRRHPPTNNRCGPSSFTRTEPPISSRSGLEHTSGRDISGARLMLE